MAQNKPASPTRNPHHSKGGMHPMLTGIIIGLLLGIAIALGVAIWLNRAASPFIEHTKPVTPLSPTTLGQPATPSANGNAGNSVNPANPTPLSGATDPNGKPRFEFYDLLPGDKSGKANPGVGKAAASPPAKDTKDPKAAVPSSNENTTATPASEKKAAPGEGYFLQVGAFQKESDADNMKARVALTGMEAHTSLVNLADKGALYRVRLGPFANLEEVNRVKAALSQGGIGSSMARAEKVDSK